MRIRYVGTAGRRTIGEIEWNAENGYTTEVEDVELAATLVTYPRPDFELVEASNEALKALAETLGIKISEARKLVKNIVSPAANDAGVAEASGITRSAQEV